MVSSLSTRLAQLEAAQAPPVALETSFTPGIRLLWSLLAVHAGGLQPQESVATGTARALGYEKPREMLAAMKAEGSAQIEWGTRHFVAVTLLLTERGGGRAAGMTANEAAIRSLISDIPEALQNHHGLAVSEDAIKAATEWGSV